MTVFLELLNPARIAQVIGGYLEAGGPVVVVLLFSTALMWLLIGERMLYFWFAGPQLCKTQGERWKGRSYDSSWQQFAFRERLISEVQVENDRFMNVIKALILITPLLGLLGTVTGMIEVFQVIVETGASNARAMAEGISRATIPTMTGLAVSLTGVFSLSYLDRRNEIIAQRASEELDIETAMAYGYGRVGRLSGSDSEEAEVNITPLLDIVFILLIFFIVTATFLDEIGIDMKTPDDNPPEEETRPPPSMVLSVRNDGFVVVDQGRIIDPRSVKPVIEAFKAENPRGVVLLSAAPDAAVETSVLVLDQARQAGVDPAIAIQQRDG